MPQLCESDRMVNRPFLTRTATLAPVIAVMMCAPNTAAQATASHVTFASTGAEQMFVVPTGVTSIRVDAIGAPGGAVIASTAVGGLGDKAIANIAVHRGEKLYVEVGGVGGTQGQPGFNGGAVGGGNQVETIGGGGGGGSDVRTVAAAMSATSLASRLVVAGGGGGGGYAAQSGGTAGNAGAPTCSNCAGGSAGSSHAGGGGGNGGGPGYNGSAGQLGVGGNAGSDNFTANAEGGGGGGGGLYGGGGGGTSGSSSGGGGGGSSGFGHGATKTSVQADSTGVPSVTLTYTPIASTKTTVTVSRRHRTVSAHGTVKPAAPGVRVAVTLLRKHGSKYKKTAEKHPLLSTTGHYSTSFKRPRSGKCEVEVAFAGYKNLAGSHTTKKVAC
jgi:hypothetical protein